MKGSKWTWLRDKCLELGYTEAAELAQEIEEVLHKLYGETKTLAWESLKECELIMTNRGLEWEFNMNLYKIMGDVSFCRACVETHKIDHGCRDCRFAKETGICMTSDSLYARFCVTFDAEEKQAQRRKSK